MGTSAEVEMLLAGGKMPLGWTLFAGHFGVKSLESRPSVRASIGAEVTGIVGTAKATASVADMIAKAFMVKYVSLRARTAGELCKQCAEVLRTR